MKKSVRNIIIAFTIIISIASTAYYMMLPIKVEVLSLLPSDLYDYIEETGKVISESETMVTPKTSAQVIEVLKKNGDSVLKGEVLVKLDVNNISKELEVIDAQIKAFGEEKNINVSDVKSRISQQTLAVSQSKNQMDYAQEILDQMTTLFNQGNLSASELKATQQNYDLAHSAYKQNNSLLSSLNVQYKNLINSSGTLQALQSQYDALSIQLDNAVIEALSDGVLTDFDVKVGAFVSPALSIGRVIDPTHYLIETYVLTEDVINLSEGDDLVLVLKQNGVDQTFKGKIKQIAQTAEERISSLGLVEQRIKIKIESLELSKIVRSGYEVKVKFISEFKTGTLSIPKTSIFKLEDRQYVYLVKEGKATQVEITTGMDTDSLFAIESGLMEGDILIKNFKVDGLEEGKKVSY